MTNIWALVCSVSQVLAQNVHTYRGITQQGILRNGKGVFSRERTKRDGAGYRAKWCTLYADVERVDVPCQICPWTLLRVVTKIGAGGS